MEKSVKCNELVSLLKEHGYKIAVERGSIRYYGKAGWQRLIRVDFHEAKKVPAGTCSAVLKAAAIKK
jgi:predicted RNA binding protein YcfA (HicA-like mRNA interferase family)